RQEGARGVDRIADERGVEALECRVDARDEPVEDGVEMLGRDRWQSPDSRPSPARQPGLHITRAPVDGDLVSALGEAGRELLGQSFEAAVARRDAARAENADAHRAEGYPLTLPSPPRPGERVGERVRVESRSPSPESPSS